MGPTHPGIYLFHEILIRNFPSLEPLEPFTATVRWVFFQFFLSQLAVTVHVRWLLRVVTICGNYLEDDSEDDPCKKYIPFRHHKYVPLVHLLLFFIVIICNVFSCVHQLFTPDEYRGFN